jgi:hypothetical protein
MAHSQRLVKVNALVDEGIVDLVKAFNEIPRVYTTSSCEGSDDADGAFIWLRYDGSLYETADFFVELSTQLSGLEGIHVIAEWGGGDALRIEVRVARRIIARLVEVLRDT